MAQPYLIFESLNAKGTPLTQADLIRNYLLLRLPADQQQAAYDASWLPMQDLLPGETLSEFMRQYLMLQGTEVAKSAIYGVLKHRLSGIAESEVGAEIARMRAASTLYAAIIGLAKFPQADIDAGLARLRRWDVSTANPLLLKLLGLHAEGALPTTDVVRALATVESFAVRRAICGVFTNQLKRIFLSLTKDLPATGTVDWMEKTLSAGTLGRRWPRDDEFKELFMRFRAYGPPLERCRFLLERLEEDHGHKEPASYASATIEHVMPQTLTSAWQGALGERWAHVHERWLDCIANLTLTGYNGELSNAPFDRKRVMLGDSHFELNRWIAQQARWTEAELISRAEQLFERARGVWARPA